MSNPIIDAITSSIKPVLDTAFDFYEHKDKVVLKKEELDQKRIEIEGNLKLALMQELQKPQSKLYDFALAYEGAAEKQPKFIQILRSIIRPGVTIWTLVIITALMFGWINNTQLQENLNGIPEPLWNIFLTIFGFWFGGRALMQVAETWQKGSLNAARVESKGKIETAALNVAQQMTKTSTELPTIEGEQKSNQKTPSLKNEKKDEDILESWLFND